MRQIVQLEGSSWCGPISACMVLDNFGVPYDLNHAKRRFAELEDQKFEEFCGCRGDQTLGSYLTEMGLLAFFTKMGTPLVYNEDHKYHHISHKPRENRIATWYRVYDLIKCGYVAVVASQRDAGKNHYVCVDDAFIRAGEHWFSIVCPIRGAYEEQAERFMLTVDGKGDAQDWTFAKKPSTRFASAADFAHAAEEASAPAAEPGEEETPS